MDTKYVTAIVAVLVIASVLSGIATYVQAVDPTTIDPAWQPIWEIFAYVFISTAGATVFTFLRNILGYAYSYFEQNGKLDYDKNKLYSTFARFEFYMLSISKFIQVFAMGTKYEPYAIAVAGAISVLLDLVIRAINNVATAVRETE